MRICINMHKLMNHVWITFISRIPDLLFSLPVIYLLYMYKLIYLLLQYPFYSLKLLNFEVIAKHSVLIAQNIFFIKYKMTSYLKKKFYLIIKAH